VAKRRYVLSLAADADLDAIFSYLARQSGIERATAVFERIDETLELLAESPLLGRVRVDLDGEPRSLVVLIWVVFYEVRETGEGIYVWRVVDGSRDLYRLVKRPT
jgi:plasmid stabilization system protein ParE